VRLIVDNQLPIALARFLGASGFECAHVVDVGLDTACDRDIWAYARQNGLVIVTKDDDFRILASQQRSIPPQVVWVRLGNCRKDALLRAFESLLPALKAALEAGEEVVEIR
jgi:predicted nuclease of predicted toxin-antitoxin system